jgi:D-threo-aldose 1-dehydrogenase
MNPTTTRTVGTTAVEVTLLGLGGTAFANMYSAVDVEQAVETIRAAYVAGIRYFDTAPLYGRGLSETRLGAGLAALARPKVLVSTKVGYMLEPAPPNVNAGVFVESLANKVRFDYSRDAVLRSIEGSLARLGSDRLDIIYIHDPDESISLEPGRAPYERSHFAEVMDGAYPALHDLRAQGVIGAIGVGMNQWEMLCDFARAGDFDCFLLAGRYTLLEQGALTPLMTLCTQRRISVVIGGPYNSGILATGAGADAYYNYAPAPPEITERTRQIEAVCARHAVPLPAAALQFPLAHPAVVSIIPGMRSPTEVEASVAYLAQAIPGDFWAELKHLGLIDPASPVPTGDD